MPSLTHQTEEGRVRRTSVWVTWGQQLMPRLLILEKSLKTLYTRFPLVSCIHVRKSSSHKLLTTHANSHIHTKKLQHQYCGWFNFSLLSASQQNASYKHSKTTSSKMQKMTFFKRHFFLYVYVLGGGTYHSTNVEVRGQPLGGTNSLLPCVFQGSNSGD